MPLPGTTPIDHPGGPALLVALELYGDGERLAQWLGASTLPVSVHAGTAGLVSVTIAVGYHTAIIR